MKIVGKGLTYDDVLLVPQKSQIRSRSSVNTSTNLTRKIKLAIPYISSNVDTVTESEMAIAMAKMGGIGIIHRFMTIERQIYEVDKTKRSEGFIMGNPLALLPNSTLGEARFAMRERSVSSFIVVDEKQHVLGLVSDRDILFERDETKKVTELMTPREKLIMARPSVTLDEARAIFKKYKIEKLPLVKNGGTLLGLITARTVVNEERFPQATQDEKGRLCVGAAVGVVGDYMERAAELVKVGVDILVVDIAHVHSIHGMTAVKTIRRKFPKVGLIGGNIATSEGARDLIRLGCDGLKVGIGPGGICITRMVAGAGVPQLTAIMECAKVAQKARVPVIADGGTNYPGDMTKALAAGASTVMLTGWLAGTDESPGAVIIHNGQKVKVHRGAASFSAVAARKIAGVAGQMRKELAEADLDDELEKVVPEGVETFVPYKGEAKDVIQQLVGALKSGMSYANARSIRELWRNARFMEISAAGFRESKAHNVKEI